MNVFIIFKGLSFNWKVPRGMNVVFCVFGRSLAKSGCWRIMNNKNNLGNYDFASKIKTGILMLFTFSFHSPETEKLREMEG